MSKQVLSYNFMYRNHTKRIFFLQKSINGNFETPKLNKFHFFHTILKYTSKVVSFTRFWDLCRCFRLRRSDLGALWVVTCPKTRSSTIRCSFGHPKTTRKHFPTSQTLFFRPREPFERVRLLKFRLLCLRYTLVVLLEIAQQNDFFRIEYLIFSVSLYFSKNLR